MVAIVSMLASLLVNLNPLMKFDGYYLFSDLVGIDNLQDRSFDFAKWRLRKFIWGWDSEKPEIADPQKQKLLIYFGFAVWIYRFFLYLGIAILVYHLFFQPLGLIFMLIELAFFIGLPVWREIKIWSENFGEIMSSFHGKLALFIFACLCLTVFLPIQRKIEIPVTLHPQDYARYYPAISAKVEEINVALGQDVKQGDLLFRLSSDELNKQIRTVQQRLNDLISIRDRSQANLELANQRSMIETEIENTREELKGLQKISDNLVVTANFDGKIKIMDPALKEGQWVNNRFMLALLANNDEQMMSGYIRETDVDKIVNMREGKFYADYSPFKTYRVRLKNIDQATASNIFWKELSSINGGAIPAEQNPDGTISTLPQFTIYPIQFSIDEPLKEDIYPDFIGRGTVVMTGQRQILANALIKKATSIFIRDGGF
jgi:putative peptide zinc metalloprotease protein